MVGVLLLNATYEPLVVVDHRRAIMLLLGGKVDVVEERERIIASAHQHIALPSIIRLRRYLTTPHA